jgi:hypothetical protein
MTYLKRILRLFGLLIFIVFASVAVALGGGIPVSRNSRKEYPIEITMEKSKEDKTDRIDSEQKE